MPPAYRLDASAAQIAAALRADPAGDVWQGAISCRANGASRRLVEGPTGAMNAVRYAAEVALPAAVSKHVRRLG